jgi:hypothetical protein
VAQAGKVRIGKLDLDDLSYDGVYAGPVLHVLPGETMRLVEMLDISPAHASRCWSSVGTWGGNPCRQNGS